jgi:hypothetical protein
MLKTRMPRLLLATAILVGFCVWAAVRVHSSDWYVAETKYAQIKEGMTVEEVDAIMGHERDGYLQRPTSPSRPGALATTAYGWIGGFKARRGESRGSLSCGPIPRGSESGRGSLFEEQDSRPSRPCRRWCLCALAVVPGDPSVHGTPSRSSAVNRPCHRNRAARRPSRLS